jgi:hypothetical protein
LAAAAPVVPLAQMLALKVAILYLALLPAQAVDAAQV